MTKALLKDKKTPEESMDEPKVRQCLRCQSEFQSSWAGERICARCKGSNAWRSNVPLRPRPTNGSR